MTSSNARPDTSQKEVERTVNTHFDEMIASPARLAILAALVPGRPIRFPEMKSTTGLADGNLHVQTRKLAKAGYLEIHKSGQGRRSVTEFRLTDLGAERFKLHVMKLQRILDQSAGRTRLVRRARRTDDSAVWA